MVTGRIAPSNILSPARRIFAPAQVHVGEIESIDIEESEVVTSRRLDGARFELDYDHAVVLPRHRENLEAYPGLAEHAFRLKNFDDCLRLKNHVVEMFELADIERDPEERRRLLTFFVAGGGFSGTELAGELADFVRAADEARVPADPARRVPGRDRPPGHDAPARALRLAEHGAATERGYPKLVEYGMRHTPRARRRADARDEGRRRDAERGLPVERRARPDADDRQRGRHEAVAAPRRDRPPAGRRAAALRRRTSSFASTGARDLWAGGDCAAVPHPDGGTCPPVALFAKKHGAHIGENLRRDRSPGR